MNRTDLLNLIVWLDENGHRGTADALREIFEEFLQSTD